MPTLTQGMTVMYMGPPTEGRPRGSIVIVREIYDFKPPTFRDTDNNYHYVHYFIPDFKGTMETVKTSLP